MKLKSYWSYQDLIAKLQRQLEINEALKAELNSTKVGVFFQEDTNKIRLPNVTLSQVGTSPNSSMNDNHAPINSYEKLDFGIVNFAVSQEFISSSRIERE